MNKYQIRAIAGGPAPAVAKASGCATLLRALAVVLVMLTFASSAAWAQGLPLRTCPNNTTGYLCQNDIVVADANSGPPPSMGTLYLINPSTGAQTVISSGNLLNETVGVVVEPNGMLVASDRNTGIIRVDPSTGLQTVLSPAAPLNDFFGIVRESSGDFIVTDSGLNSDKIGLTAPGIQGRVLRINKTTGAQTVIAQGGNIVHPYGVAIDPGDKSIIVSDMGASGVGQGAIVRIDPVTFSQHVVWGPASASPDVTQAAPFNCPMGVTVENTGNILATVFSYFAYGCNSPGIFRVDLMSHTQVMISASPQVGWQLPFGITTEESNNILVVDETTRWIFRLSPTPFDPSKQYGGNFLNIPLSPPNGDATLNHFVNPVGITVTRFQPTVNIAQPPTVSIVGALGSPEGTAINLTSTVTGSGTPSYSWTVKKNGSPFASGSAASLTFTPDDNGTYDVGLTVTTSAGSGSASASITVTNLAPGVGITNIPASSPEGTAITLTSTVSDPSSADMAAPFTYSWTVTKNANPSPFATGSGPSLNFTPDDNGTYAVTLAVTDKDGGASTANTSITVANVAPGVTINGAPAGSVVGVVINLTNTVSDPSPVDLASVFTYAWAVKKNGNPFASGSTSSLSFTPDASGSYAVTLSVTDKDGGVGTAGKTINIVDVTPTVSINGAPVSSAEGTAITVTSTVSGTGTLADAWGVTKNGSAFAAGSGTSLTFTPDDNGIYVVTLAVTNTGGTGTDTKTINLTNVAPVIPSGGVTGPTVPLALGTPATIVANFTDAGTKDTHTCRFDWDDLTTTTVSGSPGVSETNGSGSCQATRTFAGPGVYNVNVTVTDKDGGAVSARVSQYVVVFDPAEGSVSGSGWIDSLPGAYLPDPVLAGKAKFGFQSKYQKGATVPTGKTEFSFKAAKFKFKSTVYDWLVISGSKAQYTGSGVVKVHDSSHAGDDECENESHWRQWTGDYKFILTAQDGGLSDGNDKFRIKIVDKATLQVIYDNRRGSSDDMDVANPQIISAGRITIKKD